MSHASNPLFARPPARPPAAPPLVSDSPIYRVRRIIDMWRRGRGHQYLVDWEGFGPEERSWVPSRDVLDPSLIDEFLRSRQLPLGAPGGAP
ncbi:MAG: chromo domain-containing protein [Plesiomonas sp.]